MLSNNSNFYQAELTIEKGILFDTRNRKSVGVVVSDAIYDDDIFAETGRKIVRAGMPLNGDLEDRITVPFTVTTAAAVGVLWHDVDVTNGPNNGTLLVSGHINRDRLAEPVNDFYDATPALIDELAPIGVKFYRDR